MADVNLAGSAQHEVLKKEIREGQPWIAVLIPSLESGGGNGPANTSPFHPHW
jgi:hypothetical protein